jgi:hypothetical protein
MRIEAERIEAERIEAFNPGRSKRFLPKAPAFLLVADNRTI